MREKEAAARESVGAHFPSLVLQSLERRCGAYPYNTKRSTQAQFSIAELPLWKAADARELSRAAWPVKKLAARYGLSLAVASAFAEANGIGQETRK